MYESIDHLFEFARGMEVFMYGMIDGPQSSSTSNLNQKKDIRRKNLLGVRAPLDFTMTSVPRMNAENFEEKARSLHGTKYDYSKVEYKEANAKVTIICPTHGEFQQTPSKHVNAKRGCQSCGGTKKLTVAEFIEKAKKAHGAMATRYDYSKVVTMENTATKVEIICKLHGSFHMTPMKHMAKQGCRKCSSNFSLLAIAWLEYTARTRGIQIKHALRGGEERLDINGKVYFVDGFCAELNTVFQLHGEFFHGDPDIYNPDAENKKLGKTFGELYQKTKEIEGLILSQGFRLETIWEKDWIALCKKLNLDPKEPCQNPDYSCPTAEDRKAINTQRSVQKQKERVQADPEFKKQVAAKQKDYAERNKEKIQRNARDYYVRNRVVRLAYQAERRRQAALGV